MTRGKAFLQEELIKAMVKTGISPYIKTMGITQFHVVLVAAGQSRRLGGAVAKPWIDLDGHMVISHALDGLSQHEAVKGGVIVVSPDMLQDAETLAHKIGWQAVAGGAERTIPSAPASMHWRPYHPHRTLS